MSTSLVTKKLRKHITDQFVESFSEQANNTYYLLACKHTEYTGGDSSIPIPADSLDTTTTKIYQEAVFGKRVNPSDVSEVISRYNWTSNTVYDMYDDQDGNLLDKQFYTVASNGSVYYVYKVLDNNLGVPSTESPISSTSESACNFITTGDGYTWKLMYSLSNTDFNKFATDNFMKVALNSNVAGNNVSGAIDVVKITYTGSNYDAILSGQFQADDLRESIPTISGNSTTYRLSTSASANADFYVGSAIYIDSGTGSGQLKSVVDYDAVRRVAVVNSSFTTSPDSSSTYLIRPNVRLVGDGSGFVGYASVSSNATVNNFISKINVINRGSNYTYATALLTGNTGGISNTANLRPIIPPPGGHGADPASELGAKTASLSITISNNESGFISTDNDYRQIVLIKDILFDNVTIEVDDYAGTFLTNEKIHQIRYKNLTGLIDASISGNTITGVGTDFSKSLVANDYIMVTNTTSNAVYLRQISSVTNSSQIVLKSNNGFTVSGAPIAHATITSTAIKTGNTLPYITCTNVQPNFYVGEIVVGESSGAIGNIVAISVGEKSYNNWLTLDNRTRIVYTSNSGLMPEDSPVFQTDLSLSNAFFHSANSTYVFLTSEKGPINADPDETLVQANGSSNFTLGSSKYVPDIVKNSGQVMYIENNSEISRSNSQSETIKLLINF